MGAKVVGLQDVLGITSVCKVLYLYEVLHYISRRYGLAVLMVWVICSHTHSQLAVMYFLI